MSGAKHATLFNLQGQQVWSEVLQGNTMDVSQLPAGSYVYQLKGEGAVYRGKIMIE